MRWQRFRRSRLQMAETKCNKPQDLKGTALLVLRRMSKYRLRFLAACLCMGVSSYAAVKGTYYLKPLVDDYFVPLIGKGEGAPPAGAIKLMLFMTGAFLISMVTSFLESQLTVSLGNRILFDLRNELYDHLLAQPLGEVEGRTAGALMSSFTNDMDSLGNMLRRSVPYLVNGVVTCISILVIMLRISIELTLVILLTVAVMLPVLNFFARRSMIHTAGSQACLMELNSTAREYGSSQELVRTLAMEKKAGDRFMSQNARLFEHTFRATAFNNSIFSVTNGISKLGYVAVLLSGAVMALAGRVDVGTVALFSQYYNSFYKPLTDMTRQISNILGALAGAERIFRVMDVPPQADDGRVALTDSGDGSYLWHGTGDRDGIPLAGEIVMKDVTFGYVKGTDVIRDLSLTIKPGEKVAILGSTGAGKTTVISLINRLYEIREGEITLDGIPVKDISIKSLRKAVAVVSQDTHLFTGTVADNLRFGRKDASDEELKRAVAFAGADFFIDHLPDGMGTVLDRGGETLSQGERQLLSIARAAVADAPILILDEATSSIDTYTEKKLNEAFDKLMAGRTVIVIAHRLSTVQNADRIVVMDDGRIAETGTKEELINRRGYYYRLLHAKKEGGASWNLA